MEFTEDQKKVIETRNKNILVSAAAGSGKTAVLTERIIGRVLDPDDPVDIDRILTVTFTNAAASEMRDRIRKRLVKAAENDPENIRIKEQLNLIHNASIMTIDSFCVRVIRENFEVLGIDPSFRVGDENEIGILKEDACDEILNEAYEEENDSFYKLLSICSPGKEDKDIAEYILNLSGAADSRPDSEEWIISIDRPYEEAFNAVNNGEDLKEAADNSEWARFIISSSNRALDEMIGRYESLIEISEGAGGPYMYLDLLKIEMGTAEEIRSCASYSDRFNSFTDLQFGRLSSKKDDRVDPEIRNRVKNIRTSLKEALLKIRKDLFSKDPEKAVKEMAYGYPALKELSRLVMLYRERYREKKKSKNILDFSDVEHLALKILKGESASLYKDLYREVMTDEYQDSNSIQEEILKAVARDDGYFCVGDVKQSIYSFRLAEPGIFMKRFKDYEAGKEGVRILLNKNFRSRETVIDSVNNVFALIMHEQAGGVEYDESQRLNYGCSYGGNEEDYRTELVLIEETEDEEIEKNEKEAYYAAFRIKEMIGSLIITERQGDETVERKAEYSDFAILLRTASGNDEVFRDILIKRGIPAVTEARSGYFKTKEVRHVINVLNILDNPRQDIPFIAVLKSPFGGFNDEELSLIRSKHSDGSFFTAFEKAELEGDIRIKRDSFLKKLKSYRDIISYTPIHELIRMIIEDNHYFLSEVRNERGRENLRLLIKRAADYEKTGFRGLFRFIRYIERMKKSEMDLGEAGISDAGNAVRIMSIHKSKGLEFPVVFLCLMGKEFNMKDSRGELLIHKDMGVGLSLSDQDRKVRFNPVLKDAISSRMRSDTIGEELRILYVAMTRAKEKLIMTGTIKEYEKLFEKIYSVQNAASFLDLMLSAESEEPESFREYIDIVRTDINEITISDLNDALNMMSIRDGIRAGAIKSPSDTGLRINDNLNWKYGHEAAIRTASKVSVSELKKKAMEESEGEAVPDALDSISEETPEEKAEKEKKRAEAAERGTAFHKVMSLLPPDLEPDINKIEAFLNTLIEKKNLLLSEKELINTNDIRAFLNTGLWKRMREALVRGDLYREQPFIMGRKASLIFPEGPDDETVQIQGIIDAFFEEDDALVVMDYKTDNVHNEGTLVRRYKKQLELYSDALEQIFRKKVKERMIYSVKLDKEISL